MLFCVNGLVIKETAVRESDKILTVLTAEYGKISIYANGVRSYKSRNMTSSQIMSYCEFQLAKKGESITLREASAIECFPGLHRDLEGFTLAQYLLDVINELTLENNNEEAMLKLILNTLFVLSENKKPRKLVKAVFELRALAISGFMPDLSGCAQCGKTTDETMYFDIMNGVIKCSGCNKGTDSTAQESLYNSSHDGTAIILRQLSPSELAAMRYTLSARPERIFSFSLEEDVLDDFSVTCEKYLINHLERSYATLDFYKEITAL